MLLPIQSHDLKPGESYSAVAAPVNPCRPVRLLVGWECAKALRIQDIKIGNVSHFQSFGEVPAVHFHEFAYSIADDNADKIDADTHLIKDELATLPILDLGIANQDRAISIELHNPSTTIVPFSGAWECIAATESELLEAYTSPFQKELLKKLDRAVEAFEQLTAGKVIK